MESVFYKQIIKKARSIWLFFLDLIFPIECLGCAREGSWLCLDCFKGVNFKAKQYCLNCKRENYFGEFCPACQINYSLKGVWIASLYEDKLINRAVKNLKYRFISGLADDLGKLLILFIDNLLGRARRQGLNLQSGTDYKSLSRAKNIPSAVLNYKANLIIPVPLSAKRRRWRGFNQAELLGKIFANNYNLEINVKDLIRTKHKTPQAKLDELSRQKNIKDCFAWRGENLNGRNVILIDDVVTTGATLNECAKVLKQSGAGEVWGLVVAKG